MEIIAVFLNNLGSNVYFILLYSVIVITVFYLLPYRFRVQCILISSILFYGICDIRFLLLLVIETGFGWIIGEKIAQNKGIGNDRRALIHLIAIVVVCLGVLFLFKYCNFFIDSFGISLAEIVMPLGISYYTFKIISYEADIYTGKRGREVCPAVYFSYVMFFPHLLSGPIERSEAMTDAMRSGIHYDSELFCRGVNLVISGLFKKVVIADRLDGYVTAVFADPASFPSLAAWIAAGLYSIQLYCDFAGYSEIASGVSNMLGIPCSANFARPYLSENMREFWHRWHISLSSWLRDYVYIPLGGSREDSKWKVKRNVMAVFLACGLWHGSSLKYLTWGAYHGVFNLLAGPKGKKYRKPVRIVRHIITLLIAMFGWILFKASSFRNAAEYVRCMFIDLRIDLSSISASILPFTGDNSCVSYVITIMIVLIFLFVAEIHEDKSEIVMQGRYGSIKLGIMLLAVLLLGVSGTGSFLYAHY